MNRTEQVEALFHDARALPDGPDRDLWLSQRCDGDGSLLTEVLSLLDAHRAMREASAALIAAAEAPATNGSGATAPPRLHHLGPYRIEKLIGAGGMGAVYRAHRDDGQFEHQVAIKMMGLHLSDPAFLNHFYYERQVLANLNHPNITRLLDGGVSEDGEPYLVMEFVDGEPLDTYCKNRRLSVDARLKLFRQVCESVEYAHRNLVIHRDLKPANIMVDRDGNVKLLDFGTAKLLDENRAAATQAGLMTPRYASPEQLRGQPVNTLSDVFSLGVILYELLTGAWPFGNPNSVIDALERVVRARPPSDPLTVITEIAAEERAVNRERLNHELKGDLFTIARKMLEYDPARRYASVRQVIEDIERHQAGKPIMARPQTAWYRTSKFLTRHWLAASAAAAAFLALAILTAVSVQQADRARQQAARAQRISEFAKHTLISATPTWYNPLRGKTRAIELTDVLDNAAEQVGKELANDPLAQTDMRGTIAETYSALGYPAKAEAQLLEALTLLQKTADAPPSVAATLEYRLCDIRSHEERYAEALPACRKALDIVRRYTPYAIPDLPLPNALYETAFIVVKSGGSLQEGEALYREALGWPPRDADRRRLWPAVVKTRLGSVRIRLGDLGAGEEMLHQADAVFRAEPGPPIDIVPIWVALAMSARIRGRYEESARLLQDSLDLLDRKPASFMGREFVELDLAGIEGLRGNQQALRRLQRIEPALLKEIGPSAIDQLQLQLMSGMVDAGCGLPGEAEKRYRAALSVTDQLPAQPANRIEIYLRLAQLLASQRRTQDAVHAARQGLAIANDVYGPFSTGHPFVAELSKLAR